MNVIDIIILVPLIWAAYIGFKKGLIIEVATLIALAGGLYAGLKFSNYAASLLESHIESNLLPIASFGITFLIVVILIFTLGKLLEKVVNMIAMKLINKVLGAVFGSIKYLLIISVLLLVFNHFNEQFRFVEQETTESSLLYQPMLSTSQKLLPSLEELKDEQESEEHFNL